MDRDYYELLGVSREAAQDEIKKAYRQLARQYHPDANPDDPDAERKFKEIAEAYSVLSDPVKRRDYDMFGTARVPSAGFDPFDIFRSFFGDDPMGFSRGRGRAAHRGSDLGIELEVELDDVIRGTNKTVTIPRLQACEKCSGSGAEPGTSSSTCSRCDGTGAVRQVTRSVFGNLMTSYTCPQCRGAGQEILDPCGECNGEGRLERLDEVPIEVPAGVEDGTQFRLSGRGEAGSRGADSGDLYVAVRVKPDPRFTRQGDDLLAGVTVSATQAALGSMLELDTLEGPVDLEIPAGSQPGNILRLKGKGVPHFMRAGRGDLLVEVGVEIPTKLNEDQKTMLREFARSRGEKVSEETGFFEKIRSAFKS